MKSIALGIFLNIGANRLDQKINYDIQKPGPISTSGNLYAGKIEESHFEEK